MEREKKNDEEDGDVEINEEKTEEKRKQGPDRLGVDRNQL